MARALDSVGDRWTLLIVRELLAGPRRYTDLHADLPGVSTDVLASRLKHMEGEGLAERRRLPRPATAHVYELTPRGRELLPLLGALARFGAPALGERRPTDAVRAHWWAVPVRDALIRVPGVRGAVIDVRLDEGTFHVRTGEGTGAAEAGPPAYGEGPAPEPADAALETDAETCAALAGGALGVAEGVRAGTVRVRGEGAVADALRGHAAADA